MKKVLIIQTAFIGDVILATSLLESIHKKYPDLKIDFLLRKGNETLLNNHPFVNEVLIWDKKQGKYKNLFELLLEIRKRQYDIVYNLQRFASSGLLTCFSKAKEKIGFNKNPLSFCFTKKVEHQISNGKHEIERNFDLLKQNNNEKPSKPKLYPSIKDYKFVEQYKTNAYICLAPASVWFTKQMPEEKWVELTEKINNYKIYLLGAPSDKLLCERIIATSKNKNIENLSGKLSFLQSAALMQDAKMNYVNDSAPMHIASAVNASVTAIFCSTVPAFGFGPLSDKSFIAETNEKLNCRPCGLHGFKECPEGHFACGYGIDIDKILK